MSIRILLVDDHQMMRDGLRAILDLEDALDVVGEAGNGYEALELAETLRPDVVVMDIGMKDLNGIEATRQIRAQSPQAKVIALSTYSDESYVLGMFEAGATGYVLKDAAVATFPESGNCRVRGGLTSSRVVPGPRCSGFDSGTEGASDPAAAGRGPHLLRDRPATAHRDHHGG
jgi:DNA-binding NarL/FixJ family response regulator